MPAAVDLVTHDPEKQLSLANVRFAGSREYLVADLSVRSRGFGCEGYPFHFDRFHAERLLAVLEEMDRGGVTEAFLKDEWERDYLKFSNDRLGHVTVTGEVIVDWPEHRLVFTLETDQTVLRPLIDRFRDALEAAR